MYQRTPESTWRPPGDDDDKEVKHQPWEVAEQAKEEDSVEEKKTQRPRFGYLVEMRLGRGKDKPQWTGIQ